MAHHFAILALGASILLTGVAYGAKKQLVCNEVNVLDVEDENDNAVYLRGPRGRRGDTGQTGAPGLPGIDGQTGEPGYPGLNGLAGPKGEEGEVDYARIFAKLDVKLDAALKGFYIAMDQRLGELEKRMPTTFGQSSTIEATTTTTASTTATTTATMTAEQKIARMKAKGLCPVQHENLCFWTKVRYHQDIYHSTAKSICSKDGGQIGNIYSERHFNDVMTLIRSQIPARLTDSARTWTAMKVAPDGAVSLSNGTAASYVRWKSGWYPERGQTGIMIYVDKDEQARYQGMGDIVSTRNAYGVLCEI